MTDQSLSGCGCWCPHVAGTFSVAVVTLFPFGTMDNGSYQATYQARVKINSLSIMAQLARGKDPYSYLCVPRI